jgi:excisionase family DNA binding protein
MTSNSSKQELLSMAEAGEITGYHPDYLSALARQGKLMGQKVGRNWLITREALNAFLGLDQTLDPRDVQSSASGEMADVGETVSELIDKLQDNLEEKKSALRVVELNTNLARIREQLKKSHQLALAQANQVHKTHISRDWPQGVHPRLGRQYSPARLLKLSASVALVLVVVLWTSFIIYLQLFGAR